jgi:hypothetical protein
MHNHILVGGIGLIVLVVVLLLAGLLIRHRLRKINVAYFQKRWQEAQALCSSKNTWPLAVINADKLLDDALKRRHYKGKTMGERLVSAQHDFTNNDGVWFGHKLRNRLVHEEDTDAKLYKRDVQQALVGLRQALKDLGALFK